MANEDELSRQREKGICGTLSRGKGRVCLNARGRCDVHALDELRCTSMLEDNIGLRCWSYKRPLSDYCIHHQDFANLSVSAKEYAETSVITLMASSEGPTPVPAAMPDASVRTPMPMMFLTREAVDAPSEASTAPPRKASKLGTAAR